MDVSGYVFKTSWGLKTKGVWGCVLFLVVLVPLLEESLLTQPGPWDSVIMGPLRAVSSFFLWPTHDPPHLP